MGIMLEVMLCLLCTYINIGEVKYITEMLRLWAELETNGELLMCLLSELFYVMLG